MAMMLKFHIILCFAALTLLAACVGGGGGQVSTPVSKVTVAGTASKGLIKNGTVAVFTANSNGTKGNLLATTTTDSLGRYNVDITNYTGPVIIEVSGSYTDEATGQIKTIDPAAPLRAALPSLNGTAANIAVTPLTDLAFQKAQAAMAIGTDIATAIINANSQVSTLFHVDITAVQPVDPSQEALQNATSDQQTYTLALAAVSQMSMDSGAAVSTVINTLNNSGNAAATQVTSSLNTFLTTNSNNSTGYKSLNISLSLTGVSSPLVGSLDFTINLPSGIILPVDQNGAVDQSNFIVTVTGATNTVAAITKYTAVSGNAPAKLRVIVLDTNLLSNGQFATLLCTVPAATQISNFTIEGSVTGKDSNGVTVAGVGVVLN